jgi:hypothetical protein
VKYVLAYTLDGLFDATDTKFISAMSPKWHASPCWLVILKVAETS